MKVYVLIWEDRHADSEIELYRDLKEALFRADEIVNDHRDEDQDYTELDADFNLTDDMFKGGWHYYKVYSVEGDGVRVEEKELK
jgi:hypothetical protein